MADEDNNLNNNPFSNRPTWTTRLTPDDIGNQARLLLDRFIHDRLFSDGLNENVPPEDVFVPPGTPSGPAIRNVRNVANTLRIIGDELDQDARLRDLVQNIPPDASRDTLWSVARQIFSDGVYNWGRIVALFYFAYKLIVKTLKAGLVARASNLIRSIIEFVVEFIVQRVAAWIIYRGGWEAIVEYLGSTTAQFWTVFLLGICTAAFTVYRMKR